MREWEKNEAKLKQQTDLKKFRIEGGGRKSDISLENEDNIASWIIQNRKLGFAIKSQNVIMYAKKLIPEFNDKSDNANLCWCKRFLKKHNFTLRKISHMGQSLPDDYEKKLSFFIEEINKKRSNLNITNDKFNLIINIDETPIFYDSPFSNTLDKKGVKEVEIVTSGAEKDRVSLLLSVAADGTKLPPMIIFKGVPGAKIEKELNSLPLVKNKKIYVCCQQNSWCTYTIFNKWLKEVYKIYEINNGYKCLLILDHAPSHDNPKTIEFMKNNGIEYVFVPPGLTRKAQPLDISVNGPFKSYYKNCYTSHIINTC